MNAVARACVGFICGFVTMRMGAGYFGALLVGYLFCVLMVPGSKPSEPTP